ncbi:STAS domain-containing protein [Brasilonema bromeliae]|uniref:Anti-sigma factor antagonist n=1 Tax=Brasilonema bromeliae SPC951 TaxID=385972 RepID=A0ABX1P816_9CYAN|nr:STAS domain-containing protein [Brasilonema bromeliae]NMG20118.1 anti-sigma factor antagonist [Brasilonema bromeliae SPC951]
MVEEIKVIQPSGILDAAQSQELRKKIDEILQKESSTKTVLLDLKEVTFMDSSGLGALVLAFKALKSVDRNMVICSINEQVRILFELTGMDKIFKIYSNREEFNKTVSSGIN